MQVTTTIRWGGALAAALMTVAAVAQTVPDDQSVPDTNLDLPANLQIFGKVDPNIRKATAIVNDTVITGTDVDQRVNLVAAANNAKLTDEERQRLKLQVLRQLIDETLEIQEAKSDDITISSDEIDQALNSVAKRFGKTPAQFAQYLRASGSSERSLRRQIEGELTWQRYLRRRIEPTINVGDAEVNGILDRMKAAKGTAEYHLYEIYMGANQATAQQIADDEHKILQGLQKGEQPFDYYARTYSESSTRSVGGDLGWIQLATLPQPLAEAAQQMQVGQIAGPIETPGGFSILYLADKRQILVADPRDAKLSLKQLTVKFPSGIAQADAQARIASFSKALTALQGCGSVEKVASGIGAEVVDNDAVSVRQLPPQLQDIMIKLQVGQATPPFGSPTEGVRSLVLCGRDEPTSELPSTDQVQQQLEESRVNLRAQAKLRDLRRDAIIDYR